MGRSWDHAVGLLMDVVMSAAAGGVLAIGVSRTDAKVVIGLQTPKTLTNRSLLPHVNTSGKVMTLPHVVSSASRSRSRRG